MEYSNNFAELEIRFAFERDLVRRKGYKAFRKRGIIGICEECSEVFEKKVGNQKYCEDCKPIVRRRQVRRDVRAHREARGRGRKPSTYAQPDSPDPWTNLMIAVLQQAKRDEAEKWLYQNRELYSRAILGRGYYEAD